MKKNGRGLRRKDTWNRLKKDKGRGGGEAGRDEEEWEGIEEKRNMERIKGR